MYHVDDVFELFSDGIYVKSEFFYYFCKRVGDRLIHLDEVSGEYRQEKIDDAMDIGNQRLKFWTFVEYMWTKYLLDDYQYRRSKGDDSISFSLIKGKLMPFSSSKGDLIHPNYITISSRTITINGIVYGAEEMKDIRVCNGELIIEHKNHTSIMLGLIQNGDQYVIPINRVSNRMALIEMLYSLVDIE